MNTGSVQIHAFATGFGGKQEARSGLEANPRASAFFKWDVAVNDLNSRIGKKAREG